MWIFLHSGRALRFDEGQLAVVSEAPIVTGRPTAAIFAKGQVWVGTKSGLLQMSAELQEQRQLALGAVWALDVLPRMEAIAVGTLNGAHVLDLGPPPEIRRNDSWPDREPATAVCAADRLTGLGDAVLWGTAEGRLYLAYDDNTHPIDERLTGFISPHDGAIIGLAQTNDGQIYCATQGGGLWMYDSKGVQKRLATLDAVVCCLLAVEESVLVFTRQGRVIALTGEKPAIVAKFDRELSCAAKVGDNIFLGTRDGHIASLFEPDVLVPVADEPVVCIC